MCPKVSASNHTCMSMHCKKPSSAHLQSKCEARASHISASVAPLRRFSTRARTAGSCTGSNMCERNRVMHDVCAAGVCDTKGEPSKAHGKLSGGSGSSKATPAAATTAAQTNTQCTKAKWRRTVISCSSSCVSLGSHLLPQLPSQAATAAQQAAHRDQLQQLLRFLGLPQLALGPRLLAGVHGCRTIGMETSFYRQNDDDFSWLSGDSAGSPATAAPLLHTPTTRAQAPARCPPPLATPAALS